MRPLVLALVAVLAPAAAAQCTLTWEDPVGGLWDDAGKWDGDRVPDDTDVACVPGGAEYVVELRGAHTVGRLIVGDPTGGPGPTLLVSDASGHLTVTGSAEVEGSGRLAVAFFSSSAFGVLDGAGDVTVHGHLEWEGEITGSGAFDVTGTATLAASPRLRGRALRTTGDVTVADNARLSLLDDATYENAGTMTWAEVGGTERGVQEPGSSVPGTFINTGTLRQLGDNRLAFDVPVVNTGTVEVASGTLTFRKDSGHAGAAFSVADGARLEFSNQNIVGVFPVHDVDAASTADVAGTLAVLKAATLDLAADWTVEGMEVGSGGSEATLTGDGDLAAAGFVWGAAATITGGGLLRVTGDNPLGGAGSRGGVLDGRTLRLEGTLALFSNPPVATLRGGAVLEVAPGGELSLYSDLNAGPGGGALDNGGTLVGYNEVRVGVPVASGGAVRAVAETAFGAVLWFNAGVDCSGGSIELGGEEVRVSASAGVFDGCTLAGPGRLVARDGGTLRPTGGGLTVTAGAEVSTSTTDDVLTGTGPVTLTDGTLTSRGTVRPGDSPGVFTVAGDLAQDGGRTEIELSGPTPGADYDQLAVSGTYTADGTLAVTLVDGFAPASDDRFVIATCGTCAGAFDAVEPPPGYSMQVEQSAGRIELVVAGPTAGEEAPAALDALSAAVPNPTVGRAEVTLAVSAPGSVSVVVVDALGREVARLHDGPMAAGVAHTFALDTAGWGSGVYVVRALGPTVTATRVLTVVR